MRACGKGQGRHVFPYIFPILIMLMSSINEWLCGIYRVGGGRSHVSLSCSCSV